MRCQRVFPAIRHANGSDNQSFCCLWLVDRRHSRFSSVFLRFYRCGAPCPRRSLSASVRERAPCAARSTKPRERFAQGLAPTHVAPSKPSEVRRSEEHTSELQSLMRIPYAVFCLKKKN